MVLRGLRRRRGERWARPYSQARAVWSALCSRYVPQTVTGPSLSTPRPLRRASAKYYRLSGPGRQATPRGATVKASRAA